MISRACAVLCSVVLLSSYSLSQGAKEYGKVFFKSSVGSFKISGSDVDPAEGTVTMSFKGTVMIIGDPQIQVSGDVRKEFEDERTGRKAYHGNGKLVINGKFKTVQFFGRNVNAEWNGWGIMMLYGEFDQKLNTGEWWYSDKPGVKEPWGNYGRTVFLPRQKSEAEKVTPRPVIVPPKKP